MSQKGCEPSNHARRMEIANSFFHSELPISEVNKDNLNNITEKFNRIVYDYFHDNYGTAEKGFDRKTNYR